MAKSTSKKVSVNIKIAHGTDSNGNVLTVSQSLGSLSMSGYDDDKALAIVNLLKPCFSDEVVSVERIETSTIVAD